ncbi:MAG: glycosyltransferase [Acetobacteraceae bacterium]|nr:glycosyltransferase [Acetobacteraceae bacterium]
MGALLAGAAWFGLVAFLLVRVIRQSQAFDTAQVTAAAPRRGAAPGVAVIVPVRDEAANIGPCLAGLHAQTYPLGSYAVLVVDDGSQDGTAEIVLRAAAETDSRVALHRAGSLPNGWLGKPHACWQGVLHCGAAEWLCFMDADVRAAPDLLRDAVGAAEEQGIAMLSLRPLQELGSFWERLIVPAGMIMVACAKDLRRVNDPSSPEAEANGQFILIRRDAYAAVGGHAAVRGEICEDTALARRLKGAGFRLRVLAAEHLARTRMYRDLPSLWEGFSKNAVEIMGDARRTLAVAAAALVIGWAVPLLPLALGIEAWRHPSGLASAGFGLALAGSLAVLGVAIGTLRHFRAPAMLGLLFPLGTTVAAALAWRSVRLRRVGRVTWKGRSYPVGRPSEDAA